MGRAMVLAVLGAAATLILQVGVAPPVRAAATSPAPRVEPMIQVPNSPVSGGAEEGPANSMLSATANWAGYSTGALTPYYAISGCWTVPTVAASDGSTYSAAAIGLDGDSSAGDNDMVQVGTEQDWIGQTARYFAWWEVLPAPETPINMTVTPGDAICASLTQPQLTSAWMLALTDETSGAQFTTVLSYSGWAWTAEWIVERPSLDGSLLPLADYGQTTFDPVSAEGSNLGSLFANSGMVMLDCDPPTVSCTGAPVISTPSAPDIDGNGFTVAYGSSQPPPPTPRLSPGSAYAAVLPYRICDTRSVSVTGYDTECSGNPIGQGSTLDVRITGVMGYAGQSVPSNAQAVVLNVTAISGSATTYLTVFPAGAAPPNASNLNLTPGVNQANLVVVAMGTGGQVGIYNSAGTINVAVDVEGYFAPASGSSVPGLFHPLAPLRICDTRPVSVTGYGTECSGNSLGQGQWERVVVSGPASVPTSGAASVALNLTGVTGTASTFLSVVPPSVSDQCPSSAPGFSNLNIAAGANLPNRVIVSLGPAQDVCVYNSAGTINFILDVNGWFGNGSDTGGASFYATPPTRICDTRHVTDIGYATECSGLGLAQGSIIEIQIAGVDGIAGDFGAFLPVAVIANVTVVDVYGSTYVTLYPADNPTPPNASDLNLSSGQTTPNLAIVQLATTTGDGDIGAVYLYNSAGNVDSIVDVAGWFQLPSGLGP